MIVRGRLVALLCALVTALVLLVGVGSANAAITCTNLSSTQLTPGQWSCTVDGRSVNVYVPSGYDGVSPVALVVDMHGYTSNNTQEQSISGWDTLAASKGFIVAYPEGVANSWNAQGQCCGSSTADDVGFIRDVVATIESSADVDTTRIIGTGLSNGGSMAQTLGCQASDLFTGIAAVSYGLSGGSGKSAIINNCKSTYTRGIPEIEFHGTADTTVDYYNGVLDAIGSPDTLDGWRQVVGAGINFTTTQVTPETSCRTQYGGLNGASVALCTVTGGHHNLYPDVSSPGIAGIAWNYLEQQRTVGATPPAPPTSPTTLLWEAFDSGLGQFVKSSGSVSTSTAGAKMSGASSTSSRGSIRSGSISTVGYTTVTLDFDRVTAGLDAGEAGIAEFSTDGGSTWTTIESTQVTTKSHTRLTLPAAAAGVPNLQLRFRVSANQSNESYTVDNVALQGS